MSQNDDKDIDLSEIKIQSSHRVTTTCENDFADICHFNSGKLDSTNKRSSSLLYEYKVQAWQPH